MLDPIVDEHEKAERYPDGVFAQLGAAGLLSLPQPEEWGGCRIFASTPSRWRTQALVTPKPRASKANSFAT